jgi:hypothetical protein
MRDEAPTLVWPPLLELPPDDVKLVYLDQSAPIWDVDACNQGIFKSGNDVVMPNVAFGNALAHGIGHSFGLVHPLTDSSAAGPSAPGNTDGNNLMCTPFNTPTYCPDLNHQGSYLSPMQLDVAKRILSLWSTSSN